MLSKNYKFIVFTVAILLGGGITNQSVLAAECPPGVDPVYCQISNGTNGKVYTGSFEENQSAILSDTKKPQITESEVRSQNLDNYILAATPLFLPLLFSLILLRTIHRRFTFSLLYGISLASTSFIFFLYFNKPETGYGIIPIYTGLSLLALIFGSLVGYSGWQKKVLLVSVSVVAGILPYLIILPLVFRG